MRRGPMLFSVALVLLSRAAGAQPTMAGSGEARQGQTLRGVFGIEAAKALCDSVDIDDRLRGVERLAGIGTNEAIDALLEKLDGGGAGMKDARVRLEAVRILAPLAARDGVRQMLQREATDPGAGSALAQATPLSPLVRATAALALAKSGDKRSMSALLAAVAQPGAVAESAMQALRAYPPTTLDGFVDSRKRLTPVAAIILGELGDARAMPGLRTMLDEPDPMGRLSAAQALAKLGDEAPLTLAREWIKHPEPRLKRTAAEVMVTLGASDVPQAIAALFASESTRDDGVRLALLAPSPELAAPLATAISQVSEEQKPRVIVAMGRAGGAKAAAELGAYLQKPELAQAAAFALAEMPGAEARAQIEKAIADGSGAAKRLAVRAGVVRDIVLRDAPSGLSDALEALLASKDASDVATAVFGRVATGRMSVERALATPCANEECKAAIVAAAARGALARGGDALDDLAPLLAGASAEKPPSLTQIAAGVAMLRARARDGVPTSTLAAWAEGGGPLAPIAARALGARDDEPVRPRLKRLLQGTDMVVRANVALGLGHDPEASAASLLTSAYRFEEDASVRRAIVRALSLRTEAQRDAVLRLARDLDPDEEVRSLARAAMQGRKLDPGALEQGAGPSLLVAWLAVTANDGKAATVAEHLSARVVRPDGVALPVVADPDGALLVPRLPPGPSSLALAPDAPSDNAARRQ